MKKNYNDDDYDPEDYLSIRDVAIREIFDKHCVYAASNGQGGDEWQFMCAFIITSTLCHAILPRTDDGLSDTEIGLLKKLWALSKVLCQVLNLTSLDKEIDKQLETANSEWQKDAAKYVKDCITPESRYKLKKFIDDDKLNKILLDKMLFHIPKSQSSYIDSRTWKLTSSGNKAKEKTSCNKTQLNKSEGFAGRMQKKLEVSSKMHCMQCNGWP